jgi:CRISPR/Cas system-associated exonuclease Cas4 (RecB family)
MKFHYQELETQSVKGMRFYETPHKKYYPSITTVLGSTISEEKEKSLKSWQNSLGLSTAQQITKDAADRGTAVHLLIERYLKKEKLVRDSDSFKPEEINLFNALKLKLNKIDEVWGQEVPLYSDLLEIAGRCDCIGLYKGIPAIIDFKTSSRIKSNRDIEDYRLQLCAYSIMHNEMFDTNISQGIILMTSQTGFPQEFKVNLEDYAETLLTRIESFYEKLYSTI